MVFNMNNTIRYTIRPYDTIWMLAQVFNTSVDDIMELNPDIDPRNLMIGQVVTLIPGDNNYPSYSNQQNTSDNNMNNNMRNNIGNNMRNNNMGSNMGNSTSNNMGNSTGNNMGNSAGNNMGNNTGNNMSNNIGNSTGNNMDNDMDNDINTEEYYDLSSLFRMLWVQHVYWTRMAAVHLFMTFPRRILFFEDYSVIPLILQMP